jgi:hypothetical protein
MNKYLCALLFITLFSCTTKTEKRAILLKYSWLYSDGARLQHDVVCFDTVMSRDTGFMLFVDADLSIFRDGVRAGAVTKAGNSSFEFETPDHKKGGYEILNSIKAGEKEKFIK